MPELPSCPPQPASCPQPADSQAWTSQPRSPAQTALYKQSGLRGTKPLTHCLPTTPLAPSPMSLGRAHSTMSLISTATEGEVGIMETTFPGLTQHGSPWKQTPREPTTQSSLPVAQEVLSSPQATPGMNRTFWKSTL